MPVTEAVNVINACTDAGIQYNKMERKVDMRSTIVEEKDKEFAEEIKKSIEKGKAQGQLEEKIAIAQRLLREDLCDITMIAKLTGLTLQQVMSLKIS